MKDGFITRFEIEPYQEGPLSPYTFAVKDLIDVQGYVTGCSNPTWEKTHPKAAAHAIVIEQILQNGAHLRGKTITDELAFSLLGENDFYGTPVNPKAPDRYPGGSSSGSASVVANGLVDFALGTDTGGSIRVPASNCGIYGYRPTHGRITTAGVRPLAPSFDTVGVLASELKTLRDVIRTLLAMDKKPTLEKVEIVFLKDAFEICDSEVVEGLSSSIEKLKKAFPHKEISLEKISLQDISSTRCSIQWAEIWSELGAWIEAAKPQFGSLIEANFNQSRNFDRNQIYPSFLKRNMIKDLFDSWIAPHQFLCFPTTSSLAPKIGTKFSLDRKEDSYFSKMLMLNSISSLCSFPEISLPLGEYQSIPIGLSLLGKEGMDESLVEVAKLTTQILTKRAK